jgi:hypothetical protein
LVPVDLMLDVNADGRLVCTLVEGDATATLIVPGAADAAADLDAALADARDGGYGECVWPLTDGEYKWLFRRNGDRTEVVVLWSSGVVTGWEHVFRSDADAHGLEQSVRAGLGRVRDR